MADLDPRPYGYRARIGYTSPPLTTEGFPYEFYQIAPRGVSLVVTSLAIITRTKAELDDSWKISLRAAREMKERIALFIDYLAPRGAKAGEAS